MRIIGLVLVVLGALALGVPGFGHLVRGKAAPDRPGVGDDRTVWVAPVVSGIAVVSGLLLLAAERRQD